MIVCVNKDLEKRQVDLCESMANVLAYNDSTYNKITIQHTTT